MQDDGSTLVGVDPAQSLDKTGVVLAGSGDRFGADSAATVRPHHRGRPAPSADADPPGGSAHPGFGAPVRIQGSVLLPGLDEGFLHTVLGFRVAAKHGRQLAHQPG